MIRQIICTDALRWLNKQKDNSLPNVITGIPDFDEVNLSFENYIKFFEKTVDLLMQKIVPDGYLIFIQTDRKYNKQWIDKSTIINNIANKHQIPLLWHKIILNRPVNSIHLQRPTYSHFLCFSKTKGPGNALPDVIEAGRKLYKNATSLNAAEMAVNFIKNNSHYDTIIDPFVGQGTIVAVANKYNLKAIGIDVDINQCQKSKTLVYE